MIMALKKPGSVYAITGDAYLLNPADDLLVRAPVHLIAETGNGVFASAGNQSVTVAGYVYGATFAILMGDDNFADANNRVTVQAGGIVTSDLSNGSGTGIEMLGVRATVMNNGTISANVAVIMGGVAVAGSGESRVVNSGTIIGNDVGIYHAFITSERLVVVNTGKIVGEDYAFYSPIGGARDVILNRGSIFGQIELGAGNDLYDGRGGRSKDDIQGGTGNDTFRMGGAAEIAFGGADIDTADYRRGSGITLTLEGASNFNAGGAKGDYLNGVEVILGSLRGNDRIRAGDHDGNRLFGFGGRDTLTGFDNRDDILAGGTGQDRLTGGDGGQDHFRYLQASEGGDRITDFEANHAIEDVFEFKRAAFGNLALGVLDDGRFRVAGTNRAGDAGDRFIFRTTDDTLWYDRDGAGGAGPVLIADMNLATDLSAQNILII
jgi:Ca2+-binding RTX toxin-like protein